jgi:DNA repair exonuclease SbcCD ATPase subunit
MLYSNYNNISPEEIQTINPLHLLDQLKDVNETLHEREEELQLWRQKHNQYVEALSMNGILEDDLSRANEKISDLKSKVKNFISRDQILLSEFSVEAHVQESYSTLFQQYQEAMEKIEDMEIQLEEAIIKYQKILPYIHKLVEVEANLTIALKELENIKQERLVYSRV